MVVLKTDLPRMHRQANQRRQANRFFRIDPLIIQPPYASTRAEQNLMCEIGKPGTRLMQANLTLTKKTGSSILKCPCIQPGAVITPNKLIFEHTRSFSLLAKRRQNV